MSFPSPQLLKKAIIPPQVEFRPTSKITERREKACQVVLPLKNPNSISGATIPKEVGTGYLSMLLLKTWR